MMTNDMSCVIHSLVPIILCDHMSVIRMIAGAVPNLPAILTRAGVPLSTTPRLEKKLYSTFCQELLLPARDFKMSAKFVS